MVFLEIFGADSHLKYSKSEHIEIKSLFLRNICLLTYNGFISTCRTAIIYHLQNSESAEHKSLLQTKNFFLPFFRRESKSSLDYQQ